MIVAGIDASPTAKEALRAALYEATLRGTRLRAVHAWSRVAPVAMTGPGYVGAFDIRAVQHEAESTLRTIVRTVAGDRAAQIEQVLAEGPAGEAIIEHARDAELIVVGSRGLGAFSGMVLGSVSQYVLHHARCPVLVIPHVPA